MKELSWPKRFRRVGLALLLSAVAWAGFWSPSLAPLSWAQITQEITILHTNNVTGHLFGCPT
ncbi:MAG: hypothetical protein ACUVS3_01610 [Thermodesulfobacteriota bacterium]